MTYVGNLRHKLVFQSKTETNSGTGVVTTWSDTLTTWGEVRPLSAREVVEWGKLEHQLSHRIFMRWQSSITPEMRIEYFDYALGENRYFEIVSLINKNERNINIEILATETKDA